MNQLAFNIFAGQFIAMTLVSGGVFTQLLEDNLDLTIPHLQLTFMYAPLSVFLIVWARDRSKDRKKQAALLEQVDKSEEVEINHASSTSSATSVAAVKKPIPIYYFFLCAMADVQGTVFILMAYEYTTITSVMLLEDFTIPFAVILSVLFLKIKYNKIHYLAICICICGTSCNIYNDMFIKEQDPSSSGGTLSRILIGDLFSILGALCYALSNILQEFAVRDMQDGFHYLGWLGFFGTLITLFEASVFTDDWSALATSWRAGNGDYIFMCISLFSSFSFVCYFLIPFYIRRSGTTLLNISNVTTVIWSMLSDIYIFDKQFYPLYVVAFCLEITGVIIFSTQKPGEKRQLIAS